MSDCIKVNVVSKGICRLAGDFGRSTLTSDYPRLITRLLLTSLVPQRHD